MNGLKIRELLEASILVAISAVVIIMSQYIPFLTFVGVMIWPVPITMLVFKYNIRISIIALCALFVIIIGFLSPLGAIYLILLYGLPAVVMGFCLKKGYSSFITVIAVAVSTFLSMVITLKLSALLFGVDILANINYILDEFLTASKKILVNAGIRESQLNEVIPNGASEIISMVLPGSLAVSSLFGAYINYYIVEAVFRRLKLSINKLKPVDQWYISLNMSYGLFFITMVSGFLMLIKVENADIVFNSIYIIFNFAFTVDGLAVVSWFLKMKGVPRKAVVLILIVLIITNISALAFYLGLIDFLFDFRKINPSRRRIPPGE